MTDIAVVTVGGVEVVAAIDKVLEFAFEFGELLSPLAYFGELGFEECLDVGAWRDAVVADVGDAADFGQGEPGCLRGADESEPIERRRVVDAVAVRFSSRVGQQATALVVTDRTSGNSGGVSQLSDAHEISLTP